MNVIIILYGTNPLEKINFLKKKDNFITYYIMTLYVLVILNKNRLTHMY